MVFSCLNYRLSAQLIQRVINCQPGAIEFVLFTLRQRLEEALAQSRFRPKRYRSRSSSAGMRAGIE